MRERPYPPSEFPPNREIREGDLRGSDHGFLVNVGLAAAFIVGLLLMISVLLSGCAHLQQGRHVATVSIVSAHAVLSAVQDGEALIVCGQPTAPTPPRCVPAGTHKAIAGKLATAFGLDEQIASTVRAIPPGEPTPTEITSLLSQVTALIDEIFHLMPDSAEKASLAAAVGGVQ